MLLHIHRPHVNHIDLRALGREAIVVAELALATVVLTGSIEARRNAATPSPSAASPAAQPAAQTIIDGPTAALVRPTIEVSNSGAGVAVSVLVPASGESELQLVSNGTTATARVAASATSIRFDNVQAGTYRLILTHREPIEQHGDTAIATSSATQSESFVIAEGGAVTVQVTHQG